MPRCVLNADASDAGLVAPRHAQGIELCPTTFSAMKLRSQRKSRTMSHLLDASAKGVYAISATPFTDAGDIDWPSVDSLVEFYLQCGVQGLTILGMMGEAQKLSDRGVGRVHAPFPAPRRRPRARYRGRVEPRHLKSRQAQQDCDGCRRLRRHGCAAHRPEDGSPDRHLFRRRDRGAGRENSGGLPGLSPVDAGRHLGPRLSQESSMRIRAWSCSSTRTAPA